ncbi:hypothetical protein LSTR_LSTR009607 [Laodelphax striatellus]|uniref:Amine oxidase domain-containing protein n=1 Tax=Laodelphax striatellus TaxID=195883 RepID=A0A482WJK5_LAOST|nr:hypothetical protein LSTR_LSTR009607 [Laodelphax striatellus]
MTTKMSTNILLVGGGVTSAILSKLLSSEIGKLKITVWEKQKFVGGRFYTSETYLGDTKYSLDLGAQYITTNDETMQQNSDIYESLLKSEALVNKKLNIKGLKPMLDRTNFFAPNGMSSIVEYLFKDSRVENIFCDCELEKLSSKDCKWEACSSSGKIELFDVVVLTIPIPEFFKIDGDLTKTIQSDISSNLSSVKYSSRYAVGLLFESPLTTEFDSEYIYHSDTFRFVAFDSWRQSNTGIANSAMLHSTVQFGEENPTHTKELEEKILNSINVEFPHWPKPVVTRFHRWDQSQVQEPYNSKPGAVVLSEKPLLIMGGDGFVGSTFDQCLFSAKKIFNLLKCETQH